MFSVFFVSLWVKLHVIKFHFLHWIVKSVFLFTARQMLPGWRLPTDWSCTTGHCTVLHCTALYTPVRTIQVWSRIMIYNWELFTLAGTNVSDKSARAFIEQLTNILIFILIWWEADTSDFEEWNGECKFHSHSAADTSCYHLIKCSAVCGALYYSDRQTMLFVMCIHSPTHCEYKWHTVRL